MTVQPKSGGHPSLQILKDLIGIQSVNPSYGEGARGESGVADYVERRCRQAGLRVTRQPVLPGRDNLIVELRVGRPESVLLFEAHMDTVALGRMDNPLSPAYRGDRLYGRGACDTKGSLAGMIYAMEEAARSPDDLSSDLILCAAVDEEHAFRGVLGLLDLNIPLAGAVVGEPTSLEIVIAHKGCARFSLRTHGRAAHSSVPNEGNNAIYQMAEIIRYIHCDVEPKLARTQHPLCGSPSIVVATIQGGQQINIVPDSCEIQVDRRIVAGERPEQVLTDLEVELREYLSERDVSFTMEPLLLDWPLDTSADSQVVRDAQRVASTLGLQNSLQGVPYGSDASKLQQLRGVPSIVFGPGSIAQAHSSEEWVPVDHVERAAKFYLRLARTFGKR